MNSESNGRIKCSERRHRPSIQERRVLRKIERLVLVPPRGYGKYCSVIRQPQLQSDYKGKSAGISPSQRQRDVLRELRSDYRRISVSLFSPFHV